MARTAPIEPAARPDILAEIRRQMGTPLNVHRAPANHPAWLRAWFPFRNHVVHGTSLSSRQYELVVLRVATLTDAAYEWEHHVVTAKEAGLDEEEIGRVRAGGDAPGWSRDESALLHSCPRTAHERPCQRNSQCERNGRDTFAGGADGRAGILAEREGREVLEMLGELSDLWDVNCSDWDNDSITARFSEEGFQEPCTRFVKRLTSRPVVGVGRYTSPDRMVSLIRKGVLDMIGAARPSIADPFLPKKIEEGRIEDIRECIGCNVCVSGDNLGAPMHCTRNPNKGEEWRKGWHPERIPARAGDERVLVTASLAADALYHALMGNEAALAQAGIRRVTRIGDCLAPGTIAAALYGGHRYARELGEAPLDAMPCRRELVELGADFTMP